MAADSFQSRLLLFS